MTEPGRGTRAWWALCAGLAGGALLGWALPAAWLDWQPALVWRQPWRWWTAAFVHWSPLHLAANLAGCAVLAAFGAAARLPPRATAAWALAWPLGHAALLAPQVLPALLAPQVLPALPAPLVLPSLLAPPVLAHYGGLSGVLHAGVAVAALALLAGRGRAPRERAIGAAVLAGLALKLLLERPWAGPLAQPAGWDIATAPLAHVGGALAGLACGLWLTRVPDIRAR